MGYWAGLFVVGQTSVQFFSTLPAWGLVIFVSTLSISLWQNSMRRKCVCALILGFLWTYGHAQWQLSSQLPLAWEGETQFITGEIISEPDKRTHSSRFLFQPAAEHRLGLLQLDWYRSYHYLKQGEQWQLPLRLKRPRNYANPGSFDYARYLFLQGIVATGYVYERDGPQKLAQSTFAHQTGLRTQISEHIDQSLASRDAAALISGLAVGMRDAMTDQQWQVLQRTGTSHLLAISGLHVGLVSGFVFLLASFIAKRLSSIDARSGQIIAALLSILAALAYTALAGFALPTQRALIMVCVAMLCFISRYTFKPFEVLALAALLVGLWDPFASMHVGFWLSFGAVAVIIWIMAYRVNKQPRWQAVLCTQVWICVGLTPLTLLFFGQLAWLAPLVNLLAIPWMSFVVVPLTLLGVVSHFLIPVGADIFWLLAEQALLYLWLFLCFFANLSWAWHEYFIVNHIVIIAVLLAVACLFLPKGLPGRYLAAPLLIALWQIAAPRPPVGEYWLTLLDVGQGSAAVVQTAQHTLVFDTGMRYDTFDLGEAVVLPFLQYQQINTIDALVLSHDHLDHTGGAASLINAMPVAQRISGEPIKALPSFTTRCRAGQQWHWDGVDFEFLYPADHEDLSSNDQSCVLKITRGEQSVLLTGDIEAAAERWLVKHQAEQLTSQVVVAPHHGSRTSSSPDFVAATAPDYVLFATGYRNRYGFPQKDVYARYIDSGATAYNTAETGAIQLRINAQGVQRVDLYREQKRRWWE